MYSSDYRLNTLKSSLNTRILVLLHTYTWDEIFVKEILAEQIIETAMQLRSEYGWTQEDFMEEFPSFGDKINDLVNISD
jgi:hypothetical protein